MSSLSSVSSPSFSSSSDDDDNDSSLPPQEGNSVVELRSRIKGFLAQNGMIKGHSASPAAAVSGSSHVHPVSPSALSHASSSSSSSSSPSSSSPSSSGTPALFGQPNSNPSTTPSVSFPIQHPRAGVLSPAPPPPSPRTLNPPHPPAPHGPISCPRRTAPCSCSRPATRSRPRAHTFSPTAAPLPTSTLVPAGMGTWTRTAATCAMDSLAAMGGLGLDVGDPLELEQQQHLSGDAIHGHPSTRRSPSPSSPPYGTVDLLGSTFDASTSTFTIPMTSASYAYPLSSNTSATAPATASSLSSASASASMSPHSPASPPLHPHPSLALASPFSHNLMPPDIDWSSDVDADLLSPRSDSLDLRYPVLNGNGLSWNGLDVISGSGSGSASALRPPIHDRVHVAGLDVDYDTDDMCPVYPRIRDDDCAATNNNNNNNGAIPFYAFPSIGSLPAAVGPHNIHSPYSLPPTLAPDSPTPSRNGILGPEVMLGGNYPSGLHPQSQQQQQHHHHHQAHHHGHGNGNMQEHASAAAHHGGHAPYSVHGGNHGGNGNPHVSTSWNNHSRSNRLGLTSDSLHPPQALHHHQQQQQQQQSQRPNEKGIVEVEQQQQGQEQGQTMPYTYGISIYPQYQYNHTDESGELRYGQPTQSSEQQYPPPTMRSRFSSLYYPDLAALDRQVNQDQDQDHQVDVGANACVIDDVMNGMGDGSAVAAYYPYDAGGAFDFENGQSQQSQLIFSMTPPPPSPPPLHVIFADRGDDPLIAHYVLHVRPVQYFFAHAGVDNLLVTLARESDPLRDAMCFVAKVHQQRMRDGGGSAGQHRPGLGLGLGLGLSETLICTPDADEIGKAYHKRARSALEQHKRKDGVGLTMGMAMAGLQCVSSFLFAGGVGGWDWFL
ncbi:hypothetical protein EW145_g8095, partial [Phellinidium pouzarii]